MNGNVGAVSLAEWVTEKRRLPNLPTKLSSLYRGLALRNHGMWDQCRHFDAEAGDFSLPHHCRPSHPLGSSPRTSSRREVVYRERDVITSFSREGREPNRYSVSCHWQ